MSTLSASFGANLTTAGIVKQAMRRARVLGAGDEPEAKDVEMGSEFLMTNLQDWQNAAQMIRHVEEATLTLTSGRQEYGSAQGVPQDILAVIFPAQVVVTASNTADRVERMTYSEWMEITNRDQAGRPSLLLVELQDEVKFKLWPVPDGTVSTLRFIKHRFVRDIEAGMNADVHVRYLRALTLQLAADFADHYKQSTDFVLRLEAKAAEAKERAEADGGEAGDIIFRMEF